MHYFPEVLKFPSINAIIQQGNVSIVPCYGVKLKVDQNTSPNMRCALGKFPKIWKFVSVKVCYYTVKLNVMQIIQQNLIRNFR